MYIREKIQRVFNLPPPGEPPPKENSDGSEHREIVRHPIPDGTYEPTDQARKEFPGLATTI